jgi:hypothetical protein
MQALHFVAQRITARLDLILRGSDLGIPPIQCVDIDGVVNEFNVQYSCW